LQEWKLKQTPNQGDNMNRDKVMSFFRQYERDDYRKELTLSDTFEILETVASYENDRLEVLIKQAIEQWKKEEGEGEDDDENV
jgi:hypothetical protein